MHRKILAGLLALLLLPSVWANTDKQQQQLKQVERLIEKLQTNMQDTLSQQGALQHKLEITEELIGQLAQNLEQLSEKLNLKQQSLSEFQQQRSSQLQKLQQQRTILAQQIRSSYIIGRRDYLKILLNQEDPSVVGRMLQYYDYFNQARSLRITRISETVKHIKILEDEIQQQGKQIQTLLSQQTQEKQDLERQNQKRQTIIDELSQSLKKQDDKLKQLQQNKKHLQSLIGIIVTDSPQFTQKMQQFQPFPQTKGQLQWPVQGRLRHRFGQKKSLGSLKWQGVFVQANNGAKVQAIGGGRVEFAGWFRHLGNLLIIKHSDGYLSLYAHNRSLYKQKGDWVKAGDVIASVGNSGGQQQSGLYFELRHQGQAINPVGWFARKTPR